MTLKKELQEDVWKVLIDHEELPKQPSNKFRLLVLQLLLESSGFRLGDAFQLADDIEERYNKVLIDVDKYLEEGNGDILKVLKVIGKYYDDQIDPLIKKIKRYKDR